MLGAADGVTEVTHDTLIQQHIPRRMLAGTFAMVNSIKRTGMIAGVLAAPVVVSAAGPETAVHVAGGLMLGGAALAATCLVRGYPTIVIQPPTVAPDPNVDVEVSVHRLTERGDLSRTPDR